MGQARVNIPMSSRHRVIVAAVAISVLAPGLAGAESSEEQQKQGEEIRTLEDRAITLAVRKHLMLDPAVPDRRVRASASDGVVTLRGAVDDIRSRLRAARIARATKGVKGVVNRIKVRAERRADAELLEAVRYALGANPVTEPMEIEVAVRNGTVTLTGKVDSWPEAREAARVVLGVKGVSELENKLGVRYDSRRPDGEVARDIKARLDADVRVDSGSIGVAVKDGKATLEGVVGSVAEREVATTDAWVIGVREVDASGLEVDWQERAKMRRKELPDPSNEDVKQWVTAALVADPRVDAEQVKVEAAAGHVIISGSVGSLFGKYSAAETARNVVGVHALTNYLRVRPPGQALSDEQIEQRVRRSIEADAALDDEELEVSVSNAMVYLKGKVPSYYEKMLVREVVSGVVGVEALSNNIVVDRKLTRRADATLTRDIKDLLYWSPFVEEKQVEVEVTDGRVTLRGTVDSMRERIAAAEKAREAGAEVVRNYLDVKR